jgi:uncharacterized protein (DUF885 family)
MVRRFFILLILTALTTGAFACGRSTQDSVQAIPESADAKAKALADTYLAAYFDRFPEQGTLFGVPGRHHDRLSDNALDALKTWEAKEDTWLAEAQTIDPGSIQNSPLRATYAIVRETLDGSIGARVCRSELWNVSQMTGWHVNYGYLVTIQPVGNEAARNEALARWAALPKYIDVEIANLREGLRLKYTAPQLAVRIVTDQLNTLISSPLAESPFMSPAQRDKDPAFVKAFEALYQDQLLPSFKRYHDFVETEYLKGAREDIAVAANPDGLSCYASSVRLFSTLPVTPRQVHDVGLRQIEALTTEMKVIAEQTFHTSDVQTLLQKLRTDPQYLFKSRQELIDYSTRAVARAKAAAPGWFGSVPKADVRIEPYPKFREKNATGEYNPPAEDGSRPGLFYIGAYDAKKKSKSGPESTAFHETIPGHHFQMALALERRDMHPIGRYIINSGFVEGWALYAERLADEMKLYGSDLDRLGMLSSQAFRAVRLVVDSGIHTRGWSRKQAIDYMLAHTTESVDDASSEIDRYIIFPGQATSYMLGMLEIRKARDEAQAIMGERFDVKGFHDRVLEDGAVPVTFLAPKIRSWAKGN